MNKKEDKIEEDIIESYDTILKESSVLTSVAGIIFGFLLNISINSPDSFTKEDSIILLFSIYSVSFAVSFFIMPIIYHHIQYPYMKFEKFKIRSHTFIKFGLISGGLTMYLGLILGLKFSLSSGIGQEFEHLSYFFAAVPFLLIYLFYKKRK